MITSSSTEPSDAFKDALHALRSPAILTLNSDGAVCACGPLIRITARAERPGGVAIAKIVDDDCII